MMNGIGEQLSLLDMAFGNPVTANQASAPLEASGSGPYVVHSRMLNAYWRVDHGWVADVDNATRFSEVQSTFCKVIKWHFRGGKYTKKKGAWYWISHDGGLGRHKGADYDGPFDSAEVAARDAIAVFGLATPQMDQLDATYVEAE